MYRKHNIVQQNIISRVELSAHGFGAIQGAMQGTTFDESNHPTLHMTSPIQQASHYNSQSLMLLNNHGGLKSSARTDISHLSYLSNNSTYNTSGKRKRSHHSHVGGNINNNNNFSGKHKRGTSSILSNPLHRSLNALSSTFNGGNGIFNDNDSVVSSDSSSSLMSEPVIGADVFFPIFIWVLIHCKIKNVHRIVYVMSHYNDSDAMKTETGYNVSTLHSALDHIMRANRKLYIHKF